MRKWNQANVWAAAFSFVLVLTLGGLMGYIAVTPDFVMPTEPVVEDDLQDPVWQTSFDDLIAYLDTNGFLDADTYDPISEGVATTARWYNGIELYWWDVENLVEGSDLHTNWVSMQTEGYILLYGQHIFVPQMNGPFGMFIVEEDFPGDVDALRKAFEEFPGEE